MQLLPYYQQPQQSRYLTATCYLRQLQFFPDSTSLLPFSAVSNAFVIIFFSFLPLFIVLGVFFTAGMRNPVISTVFSLQVFESLVNPSTVTVLVFPYIAQP